MNMKNTLNIMVDIDDLALVTAVLKPGELGRLLKALAAHMAGKEDIEQYLSNSGVRLAFAMLRPSIDESLQRLATNRVNGVKGGRPRRKSAPEMTIPADEAEEKPTKKSYWCPLKLKKRFMTRPQCRLTGVADVFSKK
jgi:hypothetical protein